MTRVILYRLEAKPQLISVSPDAAGGYSMAMEDLLGGPVGCIPLYDDGGIHLCCNRDRLLFGIYCRAILLWLPLDEPSRLEVEHRGLSLDDSERDLGPKEPANGDFLLARVGADDELVDLTEDDIRLWMFWLGLDYILHR